MAKTRLFEVHHVEDGDIHRSEITLYDAAGERPVLTYPIPCPVMHDMLTLVAMHELETKLAARLPRN